MSPIGPFPRSRRSTRRRLFKFVFFFLSKYSNGYPTRYVLSFRSNSCNIPFLFLHTGFLYLSCLGGLFLDCAVRSHDPVRSHRSRSMITSIAQLSPVRNQYARESTCQRIICLQVIYYCSWNQGVLNGIVLQVIQAPSFISERDIQASRTNVRYKYRDSQYLNQVPRL